MTWRERLSLAKALNISPYCRWLVIHLLYEMKREKSQGGSGITIAEGAAFGLDRISPDFPLAESCSDF